MFEPAEFIDLVRRTAEGPHPFFSNTKDLARAYVELRAVLKLRRAANLRQISAGWDTKERVGLVLAVLEDCVDSIKAAAKLVEKASTAFGWKRKKRRKLMQAVVDCEAFSSLYGGVSDIFRVLPDLEGDPTLTLSRTLTLTLIGYLPDLGCWVRWAVRILTWFCAIRQARCS